MSLRQLREKRRLARLAALERGAAAAGAVLPQGELADSGGASHRAAPRVAGKKGPDSTKSKKFGKVREKKMETVKTRKLAGQTVTANALSKEYDIEGGEVPPFRPMTEKTLERLCSCLSWMKLATPEDYSKFRKTEGFACRVAFCPNCASFQSRRDGLKLGAMMDAMQDLRRRLGRERRGAGPGPRPKLVQGLVSDGGGLSVQGCLARWFGPAAGKCKYSQKAAEEGVEFAVLTLTTPNVRGGELKAEEKRFAKGFNNLIDDWFRVEYEEYYLGYARKLEVTYNKQKTITQQMWDGTGKYNDPGMWKYKRLGLKVGDRNPDYGTYNPHYHVLLAVTPGFFKFDEKKNEEVPAMSARELLRMWRLYMGDSEGKILHVKIQRAYKSEGGGGAATAEISKYVAKDSDYNYSPSVFRTFYGALKGCKRLTMGGIFRTFHDLFKADKLAGYLPVDDTDYKWEIEYSWLGKFYAELGRVELSPGRAAKIRGMKYSEAYDTEEF